MFLALLIKWLSRIFLFTGRIGGKNGFERKLTLEEEKNLFAEYAAGDREAEEKLVKHNMRLVAHIANKFHSTREDEDDLISVGSIGLLKAIRSFDINKANNFSTYASRCIENEILMLLRNEKKRANDMSLEESVGEDKDGNEISLMDILTNDGDSLEHLGEVASEFERVERIIRNKLDPREREIIAHRFGLFGQFPKTQKELAKQMSISRSYISRIEKRTMEILKNEMK